MTVSGKASPFRYAYAVLNADGSSRVILSNLPIAEDTVMKKNTWGSSSEPDLSAIEVMLDANRTATEAFFQHPELPRGLSVTELGKFTPSQAPAETLAGELVFEDKGFSFSYRATFKAPLLRAPEKPAIALAPDASAEQRARAELDKREIELTEEKFLSSVSDGETEVVKLFLAAGIDANRNAALNDAVGRGHTEIAVALIGAGVSDLDQPDEYGQTLLFSAIDHGKDLVGVLLVAGADANKANQYRIAPLAVAAEQGHIDIVRTLLASGAKVNARSTSGGTALSVAVLRGYGEIVRVLLDAGANVERDKDDLLALAKQQGHVEIEKMIREALKEKN